MALLEGAQRENGLCPWEAPPFAFTLHAVLDHRTAGRLHHASSNGQACGQVRVILHPAPVVVKERDDLRERLPHRLPEPTLGQKLSQATDDVPDPASENFHQFYLHPACSILGALREQGVGRGPQVAHDVHNVQDARHRLPLFEELGRQAPQTEGAIEQDDQGFAVLRIPALGVGLDQLHHRLLRPYQTGHTPHLLGAGGLVCRPFPLPTRPRGFRIHQEFRQRFGRPWLGINRVADPHQRFLLSLPLLAGAQLRLELDRLRLDHGNALAVKTHHQELSFAVRRGYGPLGIETLVVLRRLLRYLHQDALGDLEIKELRKEVRTLLKGVFHLKHGHPLLQKVRVTPLGEVDLCVQRKDPRLPGRAVAGAGNRELAEEREIVPPSQFRLPRQDSAVGLRDGWSHIACPALGEVQLYRRPPNGQQPLEDALLRFVRLELPGTFPDKCDQRLERLLAFCDTDLDIECFHGDPPDGEKHRNTSHMFPGFYHGRRIPCTQKPSPRATLSLDSFHAHSYRIGKAAILIK